MPIVIGKNFAGPQGFADTRTGEYWEVLPQITGDNLLLQNCILEHARRQAVRAKPPVTEPPKIAEDKA